jgi:hypothetical protein
MTAPTWLPPWTVASAYPAPDALSARQWSWEFVRRSPDYQARWDELIRPFWDFIANTFDDDAAWADAERRRDDDPEWHRFNANKAGSYRVEAPAPKLCAEFGLTSMLPPPPEDQKSPPGLDSDVISVAREGYSAAPTERAIVFDLSRPLPRQIERATIFLEGALEHLRRRGRVVKGAAARNRRGLWPQYLRLLDGDASGASIADMASVVFSAVANEHPDYRSARLVRDGLAAARRMRDGGYRFIS